MSINRFSSLFLLISFLSLSIVNNNFYAQTLSVKVDSILHGVYPDDGPGISFLIAKNGKAIYRKAIGKANLELDVPLSPDAVFQMGSMTKQFTAVAILLLEEQGKLGVSHPVSNYIPEYPNGNEILIHHLLTHTSGIKDYTKMKAIAEIANSDLSPQELVDFFKNEPVDFAPGTQFQYNNSGYVLLGYLIELVSGISYENFIEKELFQKAGMKNSRYASDREIVSNRAYGYHHRGTWSNKMNISLHIPYASGSLMSTVDDMLLWQEALNNNLLIKETSYQKAMTPYALNSGERIAYGYGWHLKEIHGTPSREHGGSIFGFKSMGVYLPEPDIYVVAFTNCDCNSPTQLTRDIAELALAHFLNP